MDDGVKLSVHVERAGHHAPWVIFSNSLATNGTIWDSQAAALAGRFNVLRYDQRGHGNSDVAEAAVDFARLAADVVALLDHCEIARAAFVGLSMGVPTGLAAYARAPQRFTGLILSDGQAKTAPGGQTQWRERIDAAKAQGMAALGESTARRWLADSASPLLAGLAEMIAATPLDGYTACAGALAAFDLEAVLGSITVPVLLIAGEADGRMPETMRDMAGRIGDACFATVPGAGHVPCYERPGAFNALMLPFLESLT
jgi:3-oxoadipate enol-lactonase